LLHAGLLNKDNNEERKDYENAYRQAAKGNLRFQCQRSFRAPKFSPYNVGIRLISLSRSWGPQALTPRAIHCLGSRDRFLSATLNLDSTGFGTRLTLYWRCTEIECVLKFGGKFTRKHEIIALMCSSHARTLGTISVTGQWGRRRYDMGSPCSRTAFRGICSSQTADSELAEADHM